MFSKPKDEGWFFVLGENDVNDLLALKRVTFARREETTVSLSFYTPKDSGRKIYSLFLLSDSYLGLDQQYEINFEVIAQP